MKKLLLTLFGAVFLVAATQAQIITLWDDQAPSGYNLELESIADPFGTGQGDIGAFDSLSVGQYENANPGNMDLSAYAGKSWTLSVDVYVTAAGIADATISDDNIYANVVGLNEGGYTVTNLNADAWNTLTWSGTFDSDPNALTNASCLIINNSQGTSPAAGVTNFYMDNFSWEVDLNTYFSVDNLYLRPAAGSEVGGGSTSSGTLDNQPGFDLSGTVQANPLEWQLRWSGLDLDGVGGTNDYVDFTVNVVGKSVQVTASGLGMGDNWKMAGSDELTVTVKDITLSPGTSGSVEFDSFTSAAMILVDAGGGSRDMNADGSLDFNGLTTSYTVTNGTAGQYNQVALPNNSFSSPTLIVDNPVYGAGLENDALYMRHMDFRFSWSTNEAPVYIDVTNAIEFVSSEGFVNGGLSGQVDWVEGNTNVDVVVDTTAPGTATATNGGLNATLVAPINGMQAGDTVTFSVDFQFEGTPEDLTNVTNNNFNGYYFNTGLTTQDTGEFIGANQSFAQATRFQRFFTTNSMATSVRLLKNNWEPAGNSMADIAENDELRITYEFNVGADAAATTVTVTLSNKTQLVSSGGNFALQSTALYDALVSTNGGLNVYFEANTLIQGITGVQVDRVEIIYPELYIVYDSPYIGWATVNGVVGGADDDDDSDGLSNFGEYVFGGDPVPPNGDMDQGTLPSIDGTAGDYIFELRGDDNLRYSVLTTENLAFGPWATNGPTFVTSTSTEMDGYTNNVGTSAAQLFIKLIVEQ